MGKFLASRALFKARQPGGIVALSILASLGPIRQEATAQIIPTKIETATTVESNGDHIDIRGGQLSENHNNLFHSFEQFDLSTSQTANFVTPTDITNVIGKINATEASIIDGTLQVSGSNANLYLMNPAGLLLGPNVQLNLSGSFTATAATSIDFEQGRFEAAYDEDYSALTSHPIGFSFSGAQPGAVVNLGQLNVNNGESISLIGGTVVNDGEISAPEGTVTIAAVEGDNIVRIRQTNQLLSLEVEGTENEPYNHVTGRNTITPTSLGGMLTGGDVTHATTLITHADGSVYLGGAGAIEEAGGRAIVSGTLSTSGQTGGNINVLGEHVRLAEASLEATGESGGGLIRVGGDYRGENQILSASHTVVDSSSTLNVSALSTGDGGRAIVWSDERTAFHGTLLGEGGRSSGHGGFGEVSGKEHLVFTGMVDFSAPNGELGNLLLDPENIFITDGGTNYSDGDDDYISSTHLADQLANITLEASNNITIENLSSELPTADTLRLQPGVSITFTADADGDGIGQFLMDTGDTLKTEQGDINITGAGITVGTLDTSTNEQNMTGTVAGGEVNLISTQGVSAEKILTYGVLVDPRNNSGNGGDVNIRAESGNIDVSESINTSSTTAGSESGAGGNITLSASNSIRIGPETTTSFNALNTSSSAGNHDAGESGDITLNAEAGNILITGNIAAESSAGGNNSDSGGTVTLIGNQITTQNISTQSRVGRNNSGQSGNVVLSEYITGSDSTLTVNGLINTSSTSGGNNAGDSGNVSITAATVSVEDISSVSRATQNTQQGGDITLVARDSLTVENSVIAYSWASNGNNSGSGGTVELTAGQLSIGNIATWSQARRNTGQGGDVTLSGDTINVSRILSNTAAIANAEDAGDVTITANDRLTVGTIFADSVGGGQDATIEVTGSQIDLTTSGAITGESIWFRPSTANQNINLGNVEDTVALDITESTLDAVGNGVSLIRVGRSDSMGSVRLFPSILESVGDRPPIEIVGGTELIGPDGPLDVAITEPGVGYVVGADITFDNISGLTNNNPPEPEPQISEPDPPGISEPASGNPPDEDTTQAVGSENLSFQERIAENTSLLILDSLDGNNASSLSEPGVNTAVQIPSNPTETLRTHTVLSQLEVAGNVSFGRYLGSDDSDRTTPAATVHQMQDTLSQVENRTGVRPALVYVYYVPDAESAGAVVSGSDRTPQPTDQLEVTVVTPSGEPLRRRSWGITRKQVDAANQQLRQQATSQFSTPQQYLPPAQALYQWIMEPIDDFLEAEQIGSLGFVMDDGLRTMPIATLHDGNSYLIENYSIGILPTFSLTNFDVGDRHQPALQDTEILAMGASRFENQPPLPGAEQEINLITQKLWEGDRFLNEAFVLENLEQQLRQKDYGIVHLATHAVFEAGDSSRSYIQMWDEQFSLSDISRLNLSETELELIVLSACSTALGDSASEYGFAGFTVTSGAKSALASLWPVSDEGTLGFMSQFYQHLQASPVRADALRQAQLDLIRGEVGISDGRIYGPDDTVQVTIPELTESGRWDFSHPFYWSPFTMIGNPW